SRCTAFGERSIENDCPGSRRTYSHRTIAGSITSNAVDATAAPPAEPDILPPTPASATNEYTIDSGARPPYSSATSARPTVKLPVGAWWSSPAGSNETPSCAQRIGQSTFHTSLPLIVAPSASDISPVCP